jgi:hypothetical protein
MAEAVMYKGNRPVIHDGPTPDEELLGCPECDAVYRVRYSRGEAHSLAEYRFQAGDKINAQHPLHERAILLSENAEDLPNRHS